MFESRTAKLLYLDTPPAAVADQRRRALCARLGLSPRGDVDNGWDQTLAKGNVVHDGKSHNLVLVRDDRNWILIGRILGSDSVPGFSSDFVRQVQVACQGAGFETRIPRGGAKG